MGREKGGGAEFSGIPISPQADAGCGILPSGHFSAARHRAILGTTEGLTSGVGIFPDSGFLPSASSGRPRGGGVGDFPKLGFCPSASSGAGVLAGFGAVVGVRHWDNRGTDLGGGAFSGIPILQQRLQERASSRVSARSSVDAIGTAEVETSGVLHFVTATFCSRS